MNNLNNNIMKMRMNEVKNINKLKRKLKGNFKITKNQSIKKLKFKF